jgi:hypothetical protein
MAVENASVAIGAMLAVAAVRIDRKAGKRISSSPTLFVCLELNRFLPKDATAGGSTMRAEELC